VKLTVEEWILAYLQKLTESMSSLSMAVAKMSAEIAKIREAEPMGMLFSREYRVVDKTYCKPENRLHSVSIINDGPGDIYVSVNDSEKVEIKATDAPFEVDYRAPKIELITLELKSGEYANVRIRGGL